MSVSLVFNCKLLMLVSVDEVVVVEAVQGLVFPLVMLLAPALEEMARDVLTK